MNTNRIIGSFEGDEGPLIIAIGGMHGNEPAGVKAISIVLDELQQAAKNQADFRFNGTFIGLLGNEKAVEAGVRYIDKDLNRLWEGPTTRAILNKPFNQLSAEEQELVELHHHIAAIKRPHATPPLPHAFVHIRSCVIEDAVLHCDKLAFIRHETGTSGVLEQTRINHNAVILERVILIKAK